MQAADIPAEEAVAILRARGLEEDTVARTEELLSRCQRGRFAGTKQTEYDEMLEAAGTIISKLRAAGLGGP